MLKIKYELDFNIIYSIYYGENNWYFFNYNKYMEVILINIYRGLIYIFEDIAFIGIFDIAKVMTKYYNIKSV